MHYKEKAVWTLVTDIHYSPPFSLRLLKVNSSCSAEDSEDNKENSEDKDRCSDTNKEVGVCVCVWFQYYCHGREIKHTNKRWKWSLDDGIFFFSGRLSSCRRSFICWRSSLTMRCRPKMSWSTSASTIWTNNTQSSTASVTFLLVLTSQICYYWLYKKKTFQSW